MGFNHRTDKPRREQGFTSIIAPGTTIEGDLHIEGGLHVDGTIRGNIKAQSYVIVSAGGRVIGNIDAESVYVSGYVEGKITAQDAELLEEATVVGDVQADNLTVAAGVKMVGAGA